MTERVFEHNGVTARLILSECETVLPTIAEKSALVITDPPYSEYVHSKSRAGARKLHGSLSAGTMNSRANISRKKDFGFVSLTDDLRIFCAEQFTRISPRWILAFCDVESSHLWRDDLVSAGSEYIRTGAWIKLGSTPQFTGDRPAPGFEAIVICHPPGKKRWNGGGSHALYSFPIELNRDRNSERLHATQKPLPLMLKLVRLFSDESETVIDPFMGSGTTGIACLQSKRNFIGIEKDQSSFDKCVSRFETEIEQQLLAI